MTCPICDNASLPKYRPFCSRRCADIDLAKWMTGSYSVASAEQEDVSEALDEVLSRDGDAMGKPH